MHVTELLSDLDTPVSAFAKMRGLSPMGFLLESADGDNKTAARFSLLGVSPWVTVDMSADNGQVTYTYREGHTSTATFTNPLHVLRDSHAKQQNFLRQQQSQLTHLSHLPFLGGWVGYLGYQATQYFDAIPQQVANPFDVPVGLFGLYDHFVVFDHLYRRIYVIALADDPHLHNVMLQALGQPNQLASLTLGAMEDSAVFDDVSQGLSAEGFCQLVKQAKQWVHEGQVFQIVPSHRFSLPVQADPLTMYRVVQAINPSPYGYCLQTPHFHYVGSSPETFLSVDAQQRVTLKALAGTRPRGQTPAADAQLRTSLLNDPKELAEHHMLVDLGRNDLGRVCQVGSIAVGEIGRVVNYTHVMHLSTELQGTLREPFTSFDMVKSCFPRGTLTGAPKIRAMQLLSQLEPEQRGIYAGLVGYFDLRGNMDSAIAIRSVLVKDGQAHVNAGAGVVFDSDPMSEYEETRNKARSMLKAIRYAEQLHAHMMAGAGHETTPHQHQAPTETGDS
jgi:anthranilate synthase component I